MSEQHTPGQRAEFEMSVEQHARLLEAAQPVPAMWIGGPPPSVQENANAGWQHLANELGFVWDTVAPVPGKGQRVFSAIATAPAGDNSECAECEGTGLDAEFPRTCSCPVCHGTGKAKATA